ncbi:MAG: aldehyde dehydrogenase family protein [Pseudonocardiaceae bacterium]
MPDLFIDGRWVSAREGGTREIRCPADGELVRIVDEATARDTEAAIAAARTAFDSGGWPSTPHTERAVLLRRVADTIARDQAQWAGVESLDTGKRLVESEIDMVDVTAAFRYFADLAGTGAVGHVVESGSPTALSRVVYQPVGVCGLITPWNYPLLQTSWKIAPALAAGCTVVLKPSELTPSTAILLMHALADAGLPDGAANLILGAGPTAGAPLSEHPDVDLVSFTGGLGTGKVIMAAAAGTVKKVALELGGKNPNIIFADADLPTATDYALTAAFLNSGQVCSAGTRLVVQDSVHDDVVDAVVDRARRIRLGGPFDPQAQAGPLISEQHLAKVEAYVAAGLAEGAVLRCGGARPDDPELRKGSYYLPTVLDRCTQDMSVVHEESFGPVLTVETFTDEDDAVRIGNDTRYGLAGGVFTSDVSRAQRVALRLRHGTIWINDYHPYLPQAEWGGFKQSGTGRELGPAGLQEYREAKHIYQNLAPAPSNWFLEPGETVMR